MKKNLYDNIVSQVSDICRISTDEIFNRESKTQGKRARQMIWWLAFDRNIELFYIREYTESHGLKMATSTIIHGIRAFQKRMDNDDDILKIINQIRISI